MNATEWLAAIKAIPSIAQAMEEGRDLNISTDYVMLVTDCQSRFWCSAMNLSGMEIYRATTDGDFVIVDGHQLELNARGDLEVMVYSNEDESARSYVIRANGVVEEFEMGIDKIDQLEPSVYV